MLCPTCQWENDPLAPSCSRCGVAFSEKCDACYAPRLPQQNFCPQCGKPKLPNQPEVLKRPPASYTPPYVAEKILVLHAAIEGERKQVTVVFCDIVGSTSIAHAMGAEAMHRLLNRFFDAALVEIHRYEGTLNQFLGDGFMALFGAPIAHEDHAHRAANAALAIRRLLHAQAVEKTSGRVPLRIGMNTGPVIVGKIGDNLRMDYTAIGDTTNLAARIQHLAAPGEILLTESTRANIRQHFDCDVLGERKVKGIERAVPVFRLTDARSHASRDVTAIQDEMQPMIGREQELARLSERIARLYAGQGSVIGVIGEAGLGKSRLLRELRHRQPPHVLWLEGHAMSFGCNFSYGPFIDILRAAAGLDELEAGEAAWRKLESFVADHFGSEGPGLLPFLGMLMGLELPMVAKGLVEHLTPTDVRGRIFIAARRLFDCLARKHPVVLHLEDWHWADAASSALLEHLLPLIGGVPLLILFAGRPDPETPCTRLRQLAIRDHSQWYLEILLSPLSNSEANHMVENLFGARQLTSVLRSLILRKAEGNPLFIEEIARSLQEAHKSPTPSPSSRTDARDGVDAIDLPDTIETLILARIDRLEDDVKKVLRLAAIIGRSFYRRILQAIDEATSELDQALLQLQDIDLIRKRRQIPEQEYIFKHVLVQQASYHSILVERRRELHQRVAEAIESLFPDRREEFTGLLAHHFVHAQNLPKAQHYLLKAGDQAARMASDVEALAYFREAVRSFSTELGDKWDPVERASVERKIGEVLYRLGQYDAAGTHLLSALSLLGHHHPRSRAGVRLRIVGQILVQAWHRIRWHQPALRNEQPGNAEQERIDALIALCWMDFFRDQESYLLDILTTLNWAENRNLGIATTMASSGLALALNVLGFSNIAQRYHKRAVDFAHRLGDPVSIATAALGMGVHQIAAGRWREAIGTIEAADERYKSLGKVRERATARGALACIQYARGDLDYPREFSVEFGKLGEEANDAVVSAYARPFDAVIHMERGEFDLASSALLSAIEVLQVAPDFQVVCYCYGKLSVCALWQGNLQEADHYIELGERLLRQHAILPSLAASVYDAKAWLALAKLDSATQLEQRSAYRQAVRTWRALRRIARLYAGAAPVAMCLEGCLYWNKGSTRRAQRAWERALEAARELDAPYLAAVVHRERGIRMRSAEDLEAAWSRFEAQGSRFQSAQTLRHLGQIHAR